MYGVLLQNDDKHGDPVAVLNGFRARFKMILALVKQPELALRHVLADIRGGTPPDAISF